jgi:hypothetical protein
MRPLNFGSWQEQRAHTTCARMCVCIKLVEPDGIEPTTSCLQSRRSPN